MIKSDKKIIQLTAYLILVSYLSIIVVNSIHFHKVDIGRIPTSLASSTNNQSNHLKFDGSDFYCPIQNTFNSINNSIVTYYSPLVAYQNTPEVINVFFVTPQLNQDNNYYYCLRAPPKNSIS
ncbi:MAG: hypothetical protein WAV89_13510 [Ignavibacteriaceae bacterium]